MPKGNLKFHRKADGEVRAGYQRDVAPVRLNNPSAASKKGNGAPPKNTSLRRGSAVIAFLVATFAFSLLSTPIFAAEPQPAKTMSVEEQKAQLQKQAQDGLNMIKMGQLMVENAQLQFDKLIASSAPTEGTKPTKDLAATKSK